MAVGAYQSNLDPEDGGNSSMVGSVGTADMHLAPHVLIVGGSVQVQVLDRSAAGLESDAVELVEVPLRSSPKRPQPSSHRGDDQAPLVAQSMHEQDGLAAWKLGQGPVLG